MSDAQILREIAGTHLEAEGYAWTANQVEAIAARIEKLEAVRDAAIAYRDEIKGEFVDEAQRTRLMFALFAALAAEHGGEGPKSACAVCGGEVTYFPPDTRWFCYRCQRYDVSLAQPAAMAVATSGKTVGRDDRCAVCGAPMLYRVDDDERIMASFCSNDRCPAFCVDVVPGGPRVDTSS